MVWLRSTLFYIGLISATLFFSTLALFTFFLPYRIYYRIIRGWADFCIWWLRITCGLTHQIQGLAELPKDRPLIILCKHQSAWEVIALLHLFPMQVWVLKRELLWIPFFGWVLASLKPIAIERKQLHRSLKQIVEQGANRLQQGLWVVIFPEGTRVAVGEKKRYGMGGATLAAQSGCPVVPVAHNAGTFWARTHFLKYPGVIQLRVGSPIETQGKTPQQINQLAEAWIETTMLTLETQHVSDIKTN
jgi:1-acyl-sn-glycerol-3-phosphate acyltransferase